MIKCGDFSAWNGSDLDFDKMRVAGLTHAILKVIRRDLNADKQFENNWKKCQLAGVHICGVYNYVYTPNVEAAVTAAKRVLEVLNGRKVKVWMDIEDTCMQNLGSKLIDIIKAYKHTIEDAGYELGIYTGMAWYGSYIAPYADKEILNCDYWIARYYLGYDEMALDTEPNEDKKPSVVRNLVGWQYTSSGVVDGVDGVCDLSEFYGFHNDEDNTEDNSEEDSAEDNTDEHVYATYAAYTDRWWGEVEDREDWAGAGDNKAITALIIKVSRGSVKYRVHTLNGDWLPYVTGFDYDDFNNGFAGDQKTPIDAVEIIYYTPEGEPWKYAKYMVSPFGLRNFYPEQIDNEASNGMDGYAGEFGKAIDKFQLVVE